MKNIRKVMSIIMLVVVAFFYAAPSHSEAASKYADGEYNLPFTVLKGENDERSMTNDYLISPGKLVVKNGKNLVQITLKNSSWWEDFSVPSSSVTVLSDSNDTRVVQFEVQDLDQIIPAKIHVIVPDINYNNKYDVRFKFDSSNLPKASSGDKQDATGGEKKESKTDDGAVESGNTTGNNQAENNPQTGDSAQILLLSLMLIGSGVFLVRKLTTK